MEPKLPACPEVQPLPESGSQLVANLEKIDFLYPATTLADIQTGRDRRQELVACIAEFYGINPVTQPDEAEAMLQRLRLNTAMQDAFWKAITARDLAHRLHHEVEALKADLYTNPLTGLPNKLAFDKMLHDVMVAAAEARQGVALLVMDIDKFKKVNDKFSHAHGDELLKQVADAMGSIVRQTDSAQVFHLHGDEFVIVLTGLPNEDPDTEVLDNSFDDNSNYPDERRGSKIMTNTQRGEAIRQRVREAICDVFADEQLQSLGLGASIGMAIASGHNWPDSTEFVQSAEDDLQRDKRANEQARNRLLSWHKRLARRVGTILLKHAGTFDHRTAS